MVLVVTAWLEYGTPVGGWGRVIVLSGLLGAACMMQSVLAQVVVQPRSSASTTGNESTMGVPQSRPARVVTFNDSRKDSCPSEVVVVYLEEMSSCEDTARVEVTDGHLFEYVYLHFGGTAELGVDVTVTGPRKIKILHEEGTYRTAWINLTYNALSDGIPEGDEILYIYWSVDPDEPESDDFRIDVHIRDVDGWTVGDAMAAEADGTMSFLLEFKQPVKRALVISYETMDGTAEAGSDYIGSLGTVTVEAGSKSVPILIPVLTDLITESSETFELSTYSDAFAGISKQTATGTIIDSPSLIFDKDMLNVAEGGSGTYTVRLAAEPTDEVSVDISGYADTDLTPTPASLMFEQSGARIWSAPQTVTVSAAADPDAILDPAVTLSHRASNGGYDDVTGEVVVTITEVNQIGLVVNPESVTITEGGSGSFTVKLATEPAATVIVAISGHANTDLMLDTESLEFTTSNWGTVQTVTVSAGEDDDAEDDSATLTLMASGGGYGTLTAEVSVNTAELHKVGIVLSASTLVVLEEESENYTVALRTQPTALVTVAITGHEGTDLALDNVKLTFTTTTWSTPQTVTVKAGDDDDTTADTATLTHTAEGGDYASVKGELKVNTTDNDKPGLLMDPTVLLVDEGSSNSYMVALATRPSSTVTVTIAGHDNTDVGLNKMKLTFTMTDWGEMQEVTVSAAQDFDEVNDKVTLVHGASGGGYGSVQGVVEVRVKDDDMAALVFVPQTVGLVERSVASYTVALLTIPTGEVRVSITGHMQSNLTLDREQLMFTPTTWRDPQAVEIAAGPDEDSANEEVVLMHSATGGSYSSVTGMVTIRITDDDAERVVINPQELSMTEGSTSSYSVRLKTEPSGTVWVDIESDSPEVVVSDASLRFTSDDWSTEQTVMVRAEEDANTINETVTLAHRAAGGGYDGVEEELSVMIMDNDEASLEVTPTKLALVEGDTGEAFTVSLTTMPASQVMVSVNVEPVLNDKVSVSTPDLTFTPADWNTVQTVVVTALEDADYDHEFGSLQLTASGGGYGGKSASITVEVHDDNAPRIVRVLSDITVEEGAGSAVFRVGLSGESASVITVRYHTHDGTATAGADYHQAIGVLTFAADELEKLVTVEVIDDEVDEGDETFTLELTDAQRAELGNATGRVTIVDNDAAPTVSMVPAVFVREGGTAKVHLRLSSASANPIRVLYNISDVTAAAGEDYEAVSTGSVTIGLGEMGTIIQIPTRNDTVHEGREAFLVQLDGGERTMVTILDNDPLPQLSIGDVTVSEDEGRAKLAVSLSGGSAVRVGIAFATQDITAKAGADYTRTLGTLVFAPGETVRHIWVPVARDDVVEEDEGLVVRLSAPEHAAVLDAEGNVTIKDDPIEVSIYDGTGTESSEELVMAVRLSFGSIKVVSVQFAVTGGTATSDVDYEATQGLVVFETGSTEAQIRIPLIDDDLQEGNETIEVTLSNPINTQIGQAMATGTIVDDETAPGVQVRAIAVSQSEAVFVVGLLAPVAERLTGRYRTVDGTAWAGEDYERMEGMLEFGPGETRKEVRVPLLGAQGSGEAFALMVELGNETVREEVVLGSEDTGNRARLGRSVAVHIVEAVSERMEGSLVGCMPRPFPGQRVRVSHLLSGCGMQASGERMSVWGRGAYSRLQSGAVSGADVVTASLGADYRAGDRWLMGMVVSRSEALEQEGTLLQMTGWYPYVRYGGFRHSVWGLAGAGQGVVAEAAETGIRMMAAGVVGTVVRRAGSRLEYEADGFWLGMDGGIEVSRVRAGLEGSVTLQDILEPYVEAAVLHSGGDAERGMGMEAGGGLRVRMGMLHAEVMSRRLVLHQEDGYGEWGYAGMVRYGGMEGLGAQVRPTWGRTHVETLWQAERPWEVYPSDRRMELEVGYGSRVHRRSVLRPHVGMGLRDRGRDYRIGAGVQGRTGIGFSVSGLAMEHMAPYRPVSYGVTASGYMRW